MSQRPPSNEKKAAGTTAAYASYGELGAGAHVEFSGSQSATHPPARLGRLIFISFIIIAAALYAGYAPRWSKRLVVAAETQELATPTVAVVTPLPGKAEAALALPAELKALSEASIFARSNGYLKRWLFDIGAQVKEGDLLAEIDTPEINQDLLRARAEFLRAEAAYDLAKTTAVRLTELVKTKAVGEQEYAEKLADVKLQSANVESQRANVRRLEEMQEFSRVTAPFAGTITGRQTDVGELVNADKQKVLFHLAQTKTLRCFVRVPQNMARHIKIGQIAEITLPELPGRTFPGTVTRTAGAMDAGTRTLLTELAVDNAKGELLAGSYAQARFPDTIPEAKLTLPANALLIRPEGTMVAKIGADGKVTVMTVTMGRDFGTIVEISAGVAAGDRVILNPPDSIQSGAVVRVAEPAGERKN